MTTTIAILSGSLALLIGSTCGSYMGQLSYCFWKEWRERRRARFSRLRDGRGDLL